MSMSIHNTHCVGYTREYVSALFYVDTTYTIYVEKGESVNRSEQSKNTIE